MEIKGQSVVITGGASGLGAASAKRFSELGAAVAILDLDAEQGKHQAKQTGATFIKADICSEESLLAALEQVKVIQGSARILVNCAAIGGPPIRTAGKNGAYPLDVFKKLIDINLIGAFNVTRLVAAEMTSLEPLARGERGVIINVASINALDGPVGTVAYTAAKAGVTGMTITIARDLASRGVRCCAIAPGNFETPMLMSAPNEFLDYLLNEIPFPNDRFGDPDDFARLAVHISENIMLNGEVIRLDAAMRHSQSR